MLETYELLIVKRRGTRGSVPLARHPHMAIILATVGYLRANQVYLPDAMTVR